MTEYPAAAQHHFGNLHYHRHQGVMASKADALANCTASAAESYSGLPMLRSSEEWAAIQSIATGKKKKLAVLLESMSTSPFRCWQTSLAGLRGLWLGRLHERDLQRPECVVALDRLSIQLRLGLHDELLDGIVIELYRMLLHEL